MGVLDSGPLSSGPPPLAAGKAVVPPKDQEANESFARNAPWIAAGDHTYNTPLTAAEEKEFRSYIADRSDKQDLGREFDPKAKIVDYDMRGWWKAMKAGDKRAALAVNPADKLKHRSDYWKTPYHKTFSAQSQWANPAMAPHWNERDQLVTPDGKVVFDEWKAKK
jgi:hypothetical protein